MTKTTAMVAGLAGLVVIWLLLLFFEWEDIEQDVAHNISVSLQEAGLDWVNIDTENRGRDAKLTGVSRRAEDIGRVQSLAMAARGVRDVVIDEIVLRPLLPAGLTIAMAGNQAQVTARLQNGKDAASLESILGHAFDGGARFDLEVSPDTEPATWLQSVPALASVMRGVENPTLQIEAGTLTLAGVVRTEAAYKAIGDQLASLSGFDAVDVSGLELRPLAAAWFELNRTGTGLSLQGRLGDLRGADRLRELIGGVAGAVDEDSLEVSEDVTLADWVGDLEVLAPELGVLENPAMGFRDGTFFIKGVVRSRDHYDQIAALAPQLKASNVLSLQGIELQPYISPSLEVRIEESGAVLDGNLDTTFPVERLLEALQAASGNNPFAITSEIVVGEDVAFAPWGESAAALMHQLAKVESGALLIADRTISVSGTLRSEENYTDLLRQVRAIQGSGVDRIDTTNLLFRPFKSPRFTITSSAGKILGAGLVGSGAAADKLVEAMELVFGAGDDTQILLDPDVLEAQWLDNVVRLMPSMTILEEPSLVVNADGVRLAGTARTREVFELVTAAMQRMPEANFTSDVALRPWTQPSLDIATSGQRIEVVGMMPDQQTVDKVERALSALGVRLGLPRDTALAVGDDIQQADWLIRLIEVLPDLAILSEPGLRIVDGTVTLRGIAADQSDRDRFLNQIRQATTGLILIDRVESAVTPDARPAPPSENSESAPAEGIENPEQAALDYLSRVGIPASRLAGRGYGSTQPIGDNATESGRAANRGIEFNSSTTR